MIFSDIEVLFLKRLINIISSIILLILILIIIVIFAPKLFSIEPMVVVSGSMEPSYMNSLGANITIIIKIRINKIILEIMLISLFKKSTSISENIICHSQNCCSSLPAQYQIVSSYYYVCHTYD